MIPVISTVALAVLSVIVAVAMKYETNRRLKSIQPHNIENTSIPYGSGGRMFLYVCIFIGVSAICGYVISIHTISLIGMIEIAVCYLAALAAAIIDLKTKTIPNYIPAILIAVRLIILIYEIIYVESAMSYFISSLIGCFLCALLLVIANRISKGGIGGGDIKLLSSIGFMCGVYVVFSTLFLALVSCIVFTLIRLLLKKNTLKDQLPFGPFIYIGFTTMCLLSLY